MFIGHFAVAFAAKRIAPAVSLGTLFLAGVVEGLMFAAGVALYTRATAASNGIGRNGLRALVAFLAIVYLASAFGPPPPSPAAVAWTAQAIWLLVAWAYWVDRNRSPVRTGTAEAMA